MRLAFLMAHRAQDERDAARDQRQRDALNLLRLTILLQGKPDSRQRTWRDLMAVLEDKETSTADEDRQELLDRERDPLVFVHLDSLWGGADPHAPDEPQEAPVDGGSD